MNTSLLREKLLSHWKEKLGCFIMALAIYAFYQIQRFEREEFTVPLEVKAPGNLTVRSGFALPQYVKVSLRADRGELGGISSSDIGAFIDLSYASRAGSYDFLVNVRPNRRLSSLSPLEISVQPQRIQVEIEEEIVRFVPISATISGQPAYGYESSAVSMVPTSVKLQGPKSAVEGIQEIQTEEVPLDGATESISREVGFMNLSSLVMVDPEQKVQVSVAITPIEASRTIEGIEISYDNIDSRLDISHERNLVTITVEGKLLELDRMKKNSCSASADCSLATGPGTIEVPVFIHVPDNVKLTAWTVNTVTVTFTEKPEAELSPEEEAAFGYYY